MQYQDNFRLDSLHSNLRENDIILELAILI